MYILSFFQLTIQAFDQGDPTLNSTNNAIVNVQVLRNEHAPVIDSQSPVNVLENATASTNLLKVTATDDDTRVSMAVLY